mmetsp:Transcript_29182/g.32409  ORF Transcript_29182/g.32409 Transcript_29182/m.32409 type:complete len:172 (+) Transcript_29182:64-579(+)|eukprot:CAMPEP_0168529942 /NCGR_PEP_ID=MMETSP0405-20121227/14283_1 /TAXON_ID=498012 /ORGANISM="Trichosphaerium sp, Strain Am-I-7 wt" /LENGTH=171 /DNA_ID=CAMNT_0008553911 /DNA_START=57 /DNA_END=572 /DNA_ORIENTATION=+
MIIPTKIRTQILSYLFKEGVMIAPKDFRPVKHPLLGCLNVHVIYAMRSLTSKGYVRESFNWQHYYWYLENDGIEYLRELLHLPEEIVPTTLKSTRRGPRPQYGGSDRRGGYDRGDRGDRGNRGGRNYDRKEGAPGQFTPQYGGQGGFGGAGRGAGRGDWNRDGAGAGRGGF